MHASALALHIPSVTVALSLLSTFLVYHVGIHQGGAAPAQASSKKRKAQALVDSDDSESGSDSNQASPEPASVSKGKAEAYQACLGSHSDLMMCLPYPVASESNAASTKLAQS